MLPYLITDLGLDSLFLEFAFTLSGLRITLLEGEKNYALRMMPLLLSAGPDSSLVFSFAPNHFLKQPFCGLSRMFRPQLILHVSIPDTSPTGSCFHHLFSALCLLTLLHMLFKILGSLCIRSGFLR